MTRKLEEISLRLTHAREEAARRFEHAIVEQLHDLGMKNARLSMAFAPLQEGEKLRDRFSAQGVDRIEMMFCANLGQPLKRWRAWHPAANYPASCWRSKTFRRKSPAFREAGFLMKSIRASSGRMAQVVAEKMSQIGDHHQVICVTHLPQIAAMADTQYLVCKYDENGTTRTEVTRLDEQQRAQELPAWLAARRAKARAASATRL